MKKREQERKKGEKKKEKKKEKMIFTHTSSFSDQHSKKPKSFIPLEEISVQLPPE